MRLPDPIRRGMIVLLQKDAAARQDNTAEPVVLPETPSAPVQEPLPVPLQNWLEEAIAQMRWKRARPRAADELSGHLNDQYAAFQSKGMEENTAAAATIREMGDPVATGTELDRAWRPRPDRITLGMVLLFAAIGTLLQFILRPADGMGWLGLPEKYMIGVLCLFLAYFLDYTTIGKFAVPLYFIWLVGGLIILQLDQPVYGQFYHLKQWISWFPLLFAGILYTQRGKGDTGILCCLGAVFSLCVLCMAAPSAGKMVHIVMVCTIVLLLATARGVFGKRTGKRLLLAASPVLLGMAGLLYCLHSSPHIRTRLYYAFFPTADPLGSGFVGTGIQYLLFNIPVDSVDCAKYAPALLDQNLGLTDFLLVNLKYHWGWPAFALVLTALAVLLWRGLRIVQRQKGLLAWCVGLTIVLTLAVQVFAYVRQNLGILFALADGLPLFSFGGVYFCQTMVLLGLLLSVQRTGALESEHPNYLSGQQRSTSH